MLFYWFFENFIQCIFIVFILIPPPSSSQIHPCLPTPLQLCALFTHGTLSYKILFYKNNLYITIWDMKVYFSFTMMSHFEKLKCIRESPLTSSVTQTFKNSGKGSSNQRQDQWWFPATADYNKEITGQMCVLGRVYTCTEKACAGAGACMRAWVCGVCMCTCACAGTGVLFPRCFLCPRRGLGNATCTGHEACCTGHEPCCWPGTPLLAPHCPLPVHWSPHPEHQTSFFSG